MRETTQGILFTLFTLLAFSSGAQTNTLKFTATKATDERAIQLVWRSETNAVYRVEYTPQLSGDIVWDTLVDYFPSQGTNTVFLDTGKYWTEPALPHPKDDLMRFYRVVKTDTNTLVPPVVTVTNLLSGADLSGEVEIDVHVATTNSITTVNFFVDGEEVESAGADESGNASYTINTTEWPNGSHQIFAVAETTAGTESTGIPSTVQSGAGASAKIPVTFDNYISKWNFSLPGFDASLGETQKITAEFISYSSWTLQIVDESANTVRNASGTGSTMEFDWDGNDDFGNPTADGTYNFILTANQTTAPMMAASSLSAASVETASPAQMLAMSSDGSVVPLALYPPGMADRLDLTIFEGSLSDFLPQPSARSSSPSLASASVSSLASSATSLGSPAPMYAGSGQTTQKPHRPPPKPIKGSPGRLGVAWQGDHPDPGTNGIGGFNPPANLSGSIQLTPNYLLPYGPLRSVGKIARGFENMMKKYKWKTAFNYSNDQVSASLLRKPSAGGQNLFNYCNIGLLIGHGIRGANQDFIASSTPSQQTYYPVYHTGVNAYDWVRMSQFDFGGGPGNLRWMGLYACNLLYYDNAQDMYNKGALPMNFNLHILLAAETSVFMYPEFGRKWASYMNGGEDGQRHTVIDSWNLASRDIHAAFNPVGHTVTMTSAYWPDCVNDTLLYYTDNSSTDPSDILFWRQEVYPNYQKLP